MKTASTTSQPYTGDHCPLNTEWRTCDTAINFDQLELDLNILLLKTYLIMLYIKTLVAFDNIVIYVFHFNLTAILCISVLTVTFIKLLHTYLLTYASKRGISDSCTRNGMAQSTHVTHKRTDKIGNCPYVASEYLSTKKQWMLCRMAINPW